LSAVSSSTPFCLASSTLASSSYTRGG
jgi:hypothetical protein